MPGEPGRWRCAVCRQATSRKRVYAAPPKRRCARQRAVSKHPCMHLGAYTGELIECRTGCRGKRFKLFACAVHGRCLPQVDGQGVACCLTCADYQPAARRSAGSDTAE